jgi:multidrug transporter EmrE-like cation transporter
MNIFALALTSVVLSVTGQFALRHGMTGAAEAARARDLALWLAASMAPWVWLGLLLYVSSAAVWLGVLARWEVSKAYPLVGMGFVLTLLVGWLIGEQVSVARAAGVVLIAAGVVLVASS